MAEGRGHELHPSPDQIVVARAKTCPHCGGAVEAKTQQRRGIYERIELPAVKPYFTHVERYGGTFDRCQQLYESPEPVGLEPGSPFGPTVTCVIMYLRYSHTTSLSTIVSVDELVVWTNDFRKGNGQSLAEGSNATRSARVSQTVERLRCARLMCSDETGARLQGQNQWEWVFQNEQVCLHVIRPTRGKVVIEAVMADHRPNI